MRPIPTRLTVLVCLAVLTLAFDGTCRGEWLAPGQSCDGTKASCDSSGFIIDTTVFGPLHPQFDVTVSAGNGVLLDPSTALLQWSDFSGVGTLTDESGNRYPSTLGFSNLGPSTALLISTTTALQDPIGPYDPPAYQVNRYYFLFTVTTPFGDVVLSNRDAWVMAGSISGFPPGKFPATYTQQGSVGLYLDSGPPEITKIVPVGSLFGTASGAVVTVHAAVPEPASLALLLCGIVMPILLNLALRLRPS